MASRCQTGRSHDEEVVTAGSPYLDGTYTTGENPAEGSAPGVVGAEIVREAPWSLKHTVREVSHGTGEVERVSKTRNRPPCKRAGLQPRNP